MHYCSISYRSVMVVRQDSGIADLAAMKGRTLAWADPNSTSGYLIPRSELKKTGIDPEPGRYFSKTGFGGGHEQAVVAVLQKQYDGAVTWASGIGDPAEGLLAAALNYRASGRCPASARAKITPMVLVRPAAAEISVYPNRR